jgi:hypothetical protein
VASGRVRVADDVPDVPASLKGGPAYNIACLYARFARDIQEDTYLCPGFDEAVYRHGTLDSIEQGASVGRGATLSNSRAECSGVKRLKFGLRR